MLRSLAFKLDIQYWVTHCGTDGYLYLLLQRNMLILACQLTVISFFMSITMNLVLKKNDEDSASTQQSDIVSEWLDVTFLENKQLTNYRPWFHVVMVFILTGLTVYRV